MNINDNTYDSDYEERILVHNAVLMGLHYNRKWLTWMFKSRRITVKVSPGSDRAIEHILVSLFKLMDIFEAKYGDKCDFSLHYDSSQSRYVPIFKVIYDDFVIRNSRSRQHTIKGLFVIHHFEYREEHLRPKRMFGGRIKKNILEVASAYQQSHLTSVNSNTYLSNPFYSSQFCIGGDTDVSRMLAEFKVDMDYDRYELFLYTVDSMVQWESLEGIPYIKMEVIENSLSGIVTSSSTREEMDLFNYLLKKEIPLDFDYYISEGTYKIKPNRKASDVLKEAVLKAFRFNTYKGILVTTVDNKTFVQMRADGEILQQQYKFDHKGKQAAYTIFRGQKIYPKILSIDTRHQQKVSIEDYIIYPKFLENVIRKIESRIYEKAVAKNATKLSSATNNATECVTSDTVSL